jgi:hypothetical protein
MPLGDDVRRHEIKLAEHDTELALLRQELESYQRRAEERHGEVLKAIAGKRSKGSDEGGPPVKISTASMIRVAQIIGAIIAAVLAGLAGSQITGAPVIHPLEHPAP